MQLLFVRHAQPAWVEDGKSQLNPRLTDLGHAQAEALAESAKGWSAPTALLVSPTQRTRQTAAPLADVLGLEPEIIDWFEEVRLPPEWDGVPATDVSAQLKDARGRSVNQWWEGFERGESFRDFETRITSGLLDMLEARGVRTSSSPSDQPGAWEIEAPEQKIVLVGHGGSNSVAISHLLGLKSVPWSWERLVASHASLSRVIASPMLGGFIFGLRDHSNVGHLGADQRSR